MSSELPAGPVLYGNQGSGAVTFTTVYDRPSLSPWFGLSLSLFPPSLSRLAVSLSLSLSLSFITISHWFFLLLHILSGK